MSVSSWYRILVCWVAFLASASAIHAQDRLALLVGVSDYPRPHLAPLPSSINDAQAIHDFLADNGFPPAALQLKKNPSRKEFLQALERTLRMARDLRIARGDKLEQFVFFYSGHGTTVEDGSGGDVRDEGPDDLSDEALVLLPEVGQTPRSIEELLIRDDVLFAFLQRMSRESKQLLVLMDSCHSGGMLRGTPNAKFPVKSLAETSLSNYLRAVHADTQGLRSEDDANLIRSRDIIREVRALPPELNQIESNLLFVAASAAHEQAAAGDPRSQFTDRLMAALTYRREQVLTDLNANALTIENLDTYLTSKLASVEQTPIIFARGIAESTNVFGGLFPALATQREPISPDAPSVRALHWRLMSASDNERPRKLSPDARLASGQRFVLQFEPAEDRYLYVIYVDPNFAPELMLPEASEKEYLLPARFAVTVPRNGPLVFTGAPATETLRIVLSRKPLATELLHSLSGSVPPTVGTVAEAQTRGAQELVQVEVNEGDRAVFVPANRQETIVFDIALLHD